MDKNINNGISIIIITYNRKEDLKLTLSELINEKCSFPWEIIVIDQNSSDGTEEIEYLNNPIIKYIKLSQNLGVAGGRNEGAKYAAYEYMLFIDDDLSFSEQNSLDIIYKYVITQKETSMFAFQIRNLENGLYNWPYGKKKLKMVDEEWNCKFFIGCGHVIKKSFFDSVGGYSSSLFFWGEETELILKSVASGNFPVKYNGKIKLIHRVKGNGRNGDSNRFYYQVRNRFYMIHSYYPLFAEMWYSFYYFLGYLIKAIKNHWIKEFIKGIKNVSTMEGYKMQNKLTYSQLHTYNSL